MNSQKNKKKTFYIVLVLAVAVILLFSAYQFFVVPKGGFLNLLFPMPEKEAIKKPKIKFKFDADALSSLESLRVYGDMPVEKGQTGRSNPFQVY